MTGRVWLVRVPGPYLQEVVPGAGSRQPELVAMQSELAGFGFRVSGNLKILS